MVVDEGHPLPVGAGALVGVPVACGPAGCEAVPAVRGRRGREAAQGAEARVGVLVLPATVRSRPEREAAVTAAARRLLAAWRRPQ